MTRNKAMNTTPKTTKITRYSAAEIVDEGIYLNTHRLSFTSMQERGPLPGGDDDRYIKLHGILVLPVGLALSLAYVIFLPVIGFVMVGRAGSRKIAEVAPKAAHGTAHFFKTVWRHPAEALHLRRHGHQ